MDPIDHKRESEKQWTVDPCGAEGALGLRPGADGFFAAVEADRYGRYAPWLPDVMRFADRGGLRVLEIGPGLGTDHAQLARSGAQVFCLDLTRRHLDLTLRHLEWEELRTEPVEADAERCPFGDGVFDLIYSFGVLHHTPDTAAAVTEIRRLLRPGGLAIVSLYHRHSAFYWLRTILMRGVLRGQLLRKSYRDLLSEIEYRSEHSDARPLVKVYSRRECRSLFAAFAEVRMRTDHIDLPHLLPLVPPLRGRARGVLEKVARRWGWYVTVFARR